MNSKDEAMVRGLLKIVLVLGFACGLWGSAAAQPNAPSKEARTAAVSASDLLTAYKLGSGDKLRIATFGEASLTGDYVVSGTGVVALPLIGNVSAQGLTVSEFQLAVENALRDGYLKEPRVSVEVLNYRPFYILGEVTKPGEYPYSSGLTVMNAVATANGFTYRADQKHVFIRRANDKAEQRYELTTSSTVGPGDTIRIGERYF